MTKEKIQLPAMSDQMTEAEILSWKVDVGSKIETVSYTHLTLPTMQVV